MSTNQSESLVPNNDNDGNKSKERPENSNSNSNSKIGNLGDYLLFGRYSILMCLLHELDVLPMTSMYTFMAFAGLFPSITKCGNMNLEGLSPSSTCDIVEAARNVCVPEYAENTFRSMPMEFGYYCSTKSHVKLAISFQMIGMLLGATSFGQLSDMFGRRRFLLIGAVGACIFSFITSFTHDLYHFAAAQFCTLFFAGGTGAIYVTFFMECMPKKHRYWSVIAIGFSPNMIIFAFIAYLCGDWRWTARAISLLSVPHFILQFIGHESPRWLVQHGKLEEATNVYEKIDKFNGTASDERKVLLVGLIDEERKKLEEQAKVKKYYVWHTFYTKSMVLQNLTMGYCLLATTILYYTLIFNTEQVVGSVYVNIAVLGCIRYFINIVFCVADYKIQSLGRRIGYIGCLIFITIGLFVVVSIDVFRLDYPTLKRWTVILGSATTAHLFPTAFLITGELFPTPIRNSAGSFQQLFTRIGVVIAPQFFLLFGFYPGAPYIALTVLTVISLILFGHFIPETKGTPLVDHMPHKSERIFRNSFKSSKKLSQPVV